MEMQRHETTFLSQRCSFAVIGGCYVRNCHIIRELLLLTVILIRKLLPCLLPMSLVDGYHLQEIALLFILMLQHFVFSRKKTENGEHIESTKKAVECLCSKCQLLCMSVSCPSEEGDNEHLRNSSKFVDS